MSTSPSLEQSIIFKTSHHHGNLVLNFRGRPEDEFDFYASAFHKAANVLANEIISKHPNDLDACPLVYLYRHALELYLKAIIRIGTSILDCSHVPPISVGNAMSGHSLARLLPGVKQILDHTDCVLVQRGHLNENRW